MLRTSSEVSVGIDVIKKSYAIFKFAWVLKTSIFHSEVIFWCSIDKKFYFCDTMDKCPLKLNFSFSWDITF